MKTMRTVLTLSLVTPWILGCNNAKVDQASTSTSSPSPKPTAVPPTPPPRSAAPLGGPLVIGQASVLSGTTNIPGNAHVLFQAQFKPSDTDPNDTIYARVPVVAAHTRFVAMDGTVTSSVAEYEGQEDTTGPHGIMLSPSESLESDAWYEIVVSQDGEIQVQNDPQHSRTAPVQTEWRSHFFTGSAPRLVAIERTVGEKPAKSLRLTFSEPVDASTLVMAGLVNVGSKSLATCVQLNGECSSKPGPFLLESFQISLSESLPDVLDSPLRVTLPGSTLGAGRTVHEGAGATGEALQSVGGVQSLLREVTSADWTECQEGAAKCWRDSSLPPNAKSK